MTLTILHGDCREKLHDVATGSVQCIVTSPPYWRLRRYTDSPDEIGQETTPAEYAAALGAVFAECRRVLRDDGTLWVNLGDAYAGTGKSGGRASKDKGTWEPPPAGLAEKNLIGLPWRVAFGLQDAGWILRNEIIWHKEGASMPESMDDRCARNHETVFLFSKSQRYYFDWKAIAPPSAQASRPQYRRALELARAGGLTDAHFAAIRAAGMTDAGKARRQSGTGKNTEEVQRLAAEAKQVLGGYYREFLTADIVRPSTVWSIPVEPLADEHYAPMPAALAERCIKAGSRRGDVVLDPFAGSGTTGRAAVALQRDAVLIDLGYQDLQERRLDGVQVKMLFDEAA